MTEDTQQAHDSPVQDAPDAPMPSAEPTAPDQPAPEAVAPTPEQDTALPAEVSERTKREFDKLRTQLREERARREYVERLKAQPGPQPQDAYADDPVALTAQQAFEEAARARSEMQQYLQDQEDREAYAAHPELNPGEATTFDKTLHVATRSVYLDAMLNPQDYGGKQLSFKEAADIAKSQRQPALEAARKAGAEEAMQRLTPKEQAALEAQGNPNGRQQMANVTFEELRNRSRRGDYDAIAARLKNISKVGSD